MSNVLNKPRFGRIINNNRGFVDKIVCPVCGTEVNAYEECDNFYYIKCPKCSTKVWNVNYLKEKGE